MFDFVFGLPMHALVIHAVVVFVPLSALCAIAYVVRPPWRRVLRWPTAAGALISGVSAFVAAESGEKLLVRVSTTRASTTNFELLSTHTMWGDRARIVCLAFMVVALVGVYLMPLPATAASGRAGAGKAASSPTRPKTDQGHPEQAGGLDTLRAAAAPSWVQLTLGVVVVVVSLAALVVVVITGHAGSAVVWDGLG